MAAFERFNMDTIINPPQDSKKQADALKELENKEWIDSLDYVLAEGGPQRVIELMERPDEGRHLSFHRQHALHQHD